MSRAYRIRVKESLKRLVRARDGVNTQLEILGVLAPEQMAELLRRELAGRGFQAEGKRMVRKQNGVKVAVDPESGAVSVSSELQDKVELEKEKEARVYTDVGIGADKTRKQLRENLREELEQQVKEHESELQKKATDQLEAELEGLRRELDQAVNRVTAEALKQKAAQLGQIKEMTEDPQSGSLTIVLEV
jgi:hypothetical protein